MFKAAGVNFVDAQGAAKLGEIAKYLRAKGIVFRLARVKPRVMDILERDGQVATIGPENFFLDVDRAVRAENELLNAKGPAPFSANDS